MTKFFIIENDTNILYGFEYIYKNYQVDYLQNKNYDSLTKDEFILENGLKKNYKYYYYSKDDNKFHLVSNYEYTYSGNKLQCVLRSFYDNDLVFLGSFLYSSFYNLQGELVYQKFRTLDTLTNTFNFDGFLNFYGAKTPNSVNNQTKEARITLISANRDKIFWHNSILCCSGGQMILYNLEGKLCSVIHLGQLQTEVAWPSNLPDGSYIVQLRSKERTYGAQLIKITQ